MSLTYSVQETARTSTDSAALASAGAAAFILVRYDSWWWYANVSDILRFLLWEMFGDDI